MATKSTETKSKAPKKAKADVAKVVKPAKAAKAAAPRNERAARHPHSRVVARHGSKEALAKSLAESLAKPDQDSGAIATRLQTASNSQLLRLQRVVETVTATYGNRAKLIAKIGSDQKKSKDSEYLAKLDTMSLPHLLDLAQATAKRARPSA